MNVPREDERPPFLGAWWRLYALVIAVLVMVILALAWLTRSFA